MRLDPFRLLLISLAGWFSQQQQEAIDYLQEENRVLRQQFGGKRLIMREESGADNRGAIQRRQRLGGMLNYYNRQAA